MAELNAYSKMATQNFIKAVKLVKAGDYVIDERRIESDKHICEILSIHASTMSQLKAGTRSITIDQLAIFCNAFEFSIDQLVFGNDTKKKSQNTSLESRVDKIESEITAIKNLIQV
jgi:DNA-binding Xre family transcriptional regulator